MAEVCGNGQFDRVLIELFRFGRPSDTAAILQARVFRDDPLAARIEFPNSIGELFDVFLIQLFSSLFRAFTFPRPGILIGQALFLRLLESGLLDEEALALVSLSSSAELEHHRAQG